MSARALVFFLRLPWRGQPWTTFSNICPASLLFFVVTFKYSHSMTPLKLDTQGLPNGWSDVQPGDAVVAFSRRNIYKARRVSE